MYLQSLIFGEKFKELTIWTYLLSLLTTACVLVFRIIFVFENILQENGMVGDSSVQRFVIPCDAGSLSVMEDIEMLRDVREIQKIYGVNFCSFENITRVVNMIAERESRARTAIGNCPEKSLSCGNPLMAEPSSHTLAHFTGLHSTITGNPFGTILNWSTSTTGSFVGKEFNYYNGRVRVNSTNFYFIYLSLTFRQGTKVIGKKLKQEDRRIYMTFMASILKRNGLHESAVAIPILDHVESVCDGNNDVMTMRLASHIFLNRNDEIFVKVFDVDRLIRESQGNNFGIFKLQ